MMPDPTIREQAYSLFLAEAEDLLQAIERNLSTLRVDRTTAKIHELRRSAHTLKGSAASVGLKGISTIAQGMENSFKALYKPEVEIDAELETLLLQAYGCLRVALNQVCAGETCNENSLLEQANSIVTRLKTKLGHHFDSAVLPTSKDLGVDVTRSLFAGEIQTRLDRLAEVIQTGNAADIASMLQTEAEVLRGLAESQNLPGFGAIAQASLTALKKHPDYVEEIAQVALADFRRGQAAVLAGERAVNGMVSDTLKQWTTRNPRIANRENGKGSTARNSKNTWSRLFGLLNRPAKSNAAPTPAGEPVHSNFPTSANENDDVFTVNASVADFADCIEGLESGAEAVESLPPLGDSISGVKANIALSSTLDRSMNWTNPQSTDRSTVDMNISELQLLNHVTSELSIHQNQQGYQNQQFQSALSQWLGQLQRHQLFLRQLRDRVDQLAVQSSEGSLDPLRQLAKSALITSEQLATDAITIENIAHTSQQISTTQDRLLNQLRDGLTQAQTVTIASVLNQLPPLVQQCIATYDKAVDLKLFGSTTLLDKRAIVALQNVLSNLIQITFEEGIETPEVRAQRGKPEFGSIQIRADQQGNRTCIEFKDDGQGSEGQRDRILAAAQSSSWLSFGKINVNLEPNQGTIVTLHLPLALITAQLLLCQVGQFTYGLCSEQIERIVSPEIGTLKLAGEQRLFCYDQDGQEVVVPLYAVSELVSYTTWIANAKSEREQSHPAVPVGTKPILFCNCSGQMVALEVDRILEQQELVVRSMDDPTSDSALPTPSYIRGFSVLGNGQTFLVIDAKPLTEQAHRSRSTASPMPTLTPERSQSEIFESNPASKASILVVDDSVTLRYMLSLTLQNAGYTVFQAQDGLDAIEQLQQHPEIQLVTCDVEMPRLDGFGFLTHCRESSELSQIPIVMITSQSNEQHQQFALQLGASAYLTKPFVEDTLLEMLNYLLTEKVTV